MTDAPLESPFVVGIENRERAPFTFGGMRTRAKDGNRPLIVRTQRGYARTGDYWILPIDGIPGLDKIMVERKSHVDCYGTLGGGRRQFEAELERANDEFEFAAVVIESSWHDLAYNPPLGSQMLPKSVMGSAFALSIRFPRVHWFPMGSRAMAEATTYRLLERFFLDKQKAAKEAGMVA